MIDASLTILDNGLFVELALRLARDFREVRYWSPWEIEFPTVNDRAIGDGYPELVKLEDALVDSVFESTDVYMFPDIFHAGKQQLLTRAGKPVWGSRQGDGIETRRIRFRQLQEQIGLPVPEYEIVTGLSALRDHLKESGHCFIKTTSKIRGTMETWEHLDYDQSRFKMDNIQLKAGPLSEKMVFLVEQPIESPFETGLDTYCIDGKFPKTPMQGIEIKGKFILCSAQTQSTTPKAYDDTLSALSPLLAEGKYRNFLSLEFRKDILTDPCCRCPNPGIGCQMEMISNLGQIVYEGAKGVLVEPEFEFEFGCQAAIFHDDDPELWKQFKIPPETRRWVKLMENCQVNDLECNVPRPPYGQKIGWVIGVGSTIEKMAEHLTENAHALKDLPFDIKLDSLPEAIEQIQALEDSGREFTDQPVPEASVVED